MVINHSENKIPHSFRFFWDHYFRFWVEICPLSQITRQRHTVLVIGAGSSHGALQAQRPHVTICMLLLITHLHLQLSYCLGWPGPMVWHVMVWWRNTQIIPSWWHPRAPPWWGASIIHHLSHHPGYVPQPSLPCPLVNPQFPVFWSTLPFLWRLSGKSLRLIECRILDWRWHQTCI